MSPPSSRSGKATSLSRSATRPPCRPGSTPTRGSARCSSSRPTTTTSAKSATPTRRGSIRLSGGGPCPGFEAHWAVYSVSPPPVEKSDDSPLPAGRLGPSRLPSGGPRLGPDQPQEDQGRGQESDAFGQRQGEARPRRQGETRLRQIQARFGFEAGGEGLGEL